MPKGSRGVAARRSGSCRSCPARRERRACGGLRARRERPGFRLAERGSDPLAHHLERDRARVDQDEAPAELPADGAQRARPGERVQAPTARPGGGGDDPAQHAFGLLRRIARLLAAVGGHDRVKPDVGRALSARGLLGADEARGHVRLSLDRVGVEVMAAGRPDVDEDRVVLGRPAPARLGSVVVGPDQLVEERVATEHLVQQELAVVRLAVVDVEVERAVRREQPPRGDQPRLEKREVVREAVVVAEAAHGPRAVATAAESDSAPRPPAVVLLDGERAPRLRSARVERRIEIDEVEGAPGKRFEHRQVVGEQHQVIVAQLARRRTCLESDATHRNRTLTVRPDPARAGYTQRVLRARYERLCASQFAAKITRYAIGSVLALVTSIVVFALLYVAGVGTTADSICAFVAGAVPNWVLNRRWAWEMTSRVDVVREVVGYTIVSVVALVASSAGTGWTQSWVKAHVAAHHGYRVVLVTGAYVLVQALLFVAKFVVYDRWVFTGRSRFRAALRSRRQVWIAARANRTP